VKVYVKEQGLHNQIRTVKITDVFRDGVLGTLI